MTNHSQHGTTLIITLIIVMLIMSITAIGLDMSINEFHSTTMLRNRTLAFYATENCLHQAMQPIYSAVQPLKHAPHCSGKDCVNDYSLLDFRELSVDWWQAHGKNCTKNIWTYSQLLTESTSDGSAFYRIVTYHYPNQLLQVTVGKSFVTQNTTPISWKQE